MKNAKVEEEALPMVGTGKFRPEEETVMVEVFLKLLV